MPCFNPWDGFKAVKGRGVKASRAHAYSDRKLTLPCGQCIGCRLDRARDWSTRIMHEADTHEANSFLTLTFADEHLPWDYSVSVRDIQLFLKRLRKSIAPAKIRFLACGEYGDEGLRPHYHVIVFGHDFAEDRIHWRNSPAGYSLFRSPQLERLWPFGHSEIGSVTRESASYVARYVLKKVTGSKAEQHYQRINPITGELVTVRPEFIVMSTGGRNGAGGIGLEWFKRFESDAFPSDFVIVDGKKQPIPRYYMRKVQERLDKWGHEVENWDVTQQDDLYRIRNARIVRAKAHADNNTPDRLAIREEVAHHRVALQKRGVE